MCPRIAIVFYCLGTLDILNVTEPQSTELDRQTWREWLWEQQVCEMICPTSVFEQCDDRIAAGPNGTGFRPSPYVTPEGCKDVGAPASVTST